MRVAQAKKITNEKFSIFRGTQIVNRELCIQIFFGVALVTEQSNSHDQFTIQIQLDYCTLKPQKRPIRGSKKGRSSRRRFQQPRKVTLPNTETRLGSSLRHSRKSSTHLPGRDHRHTLVVLPHHHHILSKLQLRPFRPVLLFDSFPTPAPFLSSTSSTDKLACRSKVSPPRFFLSLLFRDVNRIVVPPSRITSPTNNSHSFQ